jgi:hypothetical protein
MKISVWTKQLNHFIREAGTLLRSRGHSQAEASDAHGHTLILLYECSDYTRHHRLLVCTLFKQRVPNARIVHLAPREAFTPQWDEQLHSTEVQA